MNNYDFNRLSLDKKRKILLLQGVCLFTYETMGVVVKLFQVEGFYIEIFADGLNKEILSVKTFEDTNQLEPYLKDIDISALFI